MVDISRAVILAAGMGTRFLPATKAVPKELLPVLDRPLLQHVVEEVVEAGIYEIVIVDAPGKEAIREHFTPDPELLAFLEERGKPDLRDAVARINELAEFKFATQEEPLGVADAIRAARHLVEGAPFALLFPDDLILGARPAIGQLADAYEPGTGAVVAVEEVHHEEISQYGIVDVGGEENPAPLRRVIEKPSPEEAPSNLAIVGRYVLGPTIFEHIDHIGKRGAELQVTDAIQRQIDHGEPAFAYRFEGRRFDAGRPGGFIAATVAMALQREDLRPYVLREVEHNP